MTVITRPTLAPPLRIAWLLLIALLAVALAGSVAVVGSRLLTAPVPQGVLPAIAAIPQGDEAVFAYATWIGDSSGQTDGDIYTVRADGTDVRQLTSGPGIDSHPTWSPDGTRIAYRQWKDGADAVMVMDAGGGNQMTLATNDASSVYCVARWNLAWSPDGTSLIFPTRDGCAGAHGLSIVAADGSSPAVMLLAPGMSSLYGAWSPDGTQIALLGSEEAGTRGLYLVDVGPVGALGGGLQARRIGPELEGGIADASSGPQWSPDGMELAVASSDGVEFRVVGTVGILVVQADDSEYRALVGDGEGEYNPAWSPSGQQVAFQRTVDPSEWVNDRPCTVRTWIVDADGRNKRQLDELGDGCGTPPLWSPDGTRIASVLITPTSAGQDPVFQLGFVMVDGSSPPVLLADAYGSWQPVAAPLPPAISPAP